MCVFTFYFVSGIICSEITGPLRIYNSRGNGKISLNFNCQLNVKIRNMCSRHTAENNRKMNVHGIWEYVYLYMYLYSFCIIVIIIITNIVPVQNYLYQATWCGPHITPNRFSIHLIHWLSFCAMQWCTVFYCTIPLRVLWVWSDELMWYFGIVYFMLQEMISQHSYRSNVNKYTMKLLKRIVGLKISIYK